MVIIPGNRGVSFGGAGGAGGGAGGGGFGGGAGKRRNLIKTVGTF